MTVIDYGAFLAAKSPAVTPGGMRDVPDLPERLKPFQRAITAWALRQGRCAIFAGTGLGKTAMQLAWGRAVACHTQGRVLLLAPLAVAQQTVVEARKFGIDGVAYSGDQESATTDIVVTNYDRMHLFEPRAFSAIILDESSIIKSHDSKTRSTLIEAFNKTQWRLCCSATPAPNDYVELGNHAEFLGIMTEKEMLSMFFVHDGKVRAPGAEGQDGWRLKRHAKQDFWRWLASWSVVVRDPNEIGYDEPDYVLPPLVQKQVTVKVPYAPVGGALFPMEARTMSERIGARRSSQRERIAAALQLIRDGLRDKLPTCYQTIQNNGAEPLHASDTPQIPIARPTSRLPLSGISEQTQVRPIIQNITKPIKKSGKAGQKNSKTDTTRADASNTPQILNLENAKRLLQEAGINQQDEADDCLIAMGLTPPNTPELKSDKMADAPSVAARMATRQADLSSSIIATSMATTSEDFSAQTATSASESSETTSICSIEPLNTYWRDDARWIVWCQLNSEQDLLERALGDRCFSVYGSLSSEEKTRRIFAWLRGERPVLLSKVSICGFGMNFQCCSNAVFVGLNDSFEQLFQAKRRCWRFGQQNPVNVYLISSELEGAVLANLERKEADYEAMSTAMAEEMTHLVKGNLQKSAPREATYATERSHGDGWEMRLGDAVEEMRDIADGSIHFSLHSPPFVSLYTFSDSPRDLSNCKEDETFWDHYKFVIDEMFRVTMPGRLAAIHCINLPTSKIRDGFIGLRDFRGDIIRAFQGDDAAELYRAIKVLDLRSAAAFADGDFQRGVRLTDLADKMNDDLTSHPGMSNFIYHSEICIRKDPVSAMQRSKSIGLLHKQVVKDSSLSRQAVADYVVVMRKPGDNPERIAGAFERYYGTGDVAAEDHGAVAAHIAGSYSVQVWQRYAEPVWMDISQSDVLSNRLARAEEDERHIAPLQLTVIRRCYQIWTNPGDLVLSPFAGIGSEGYVALEMGRRFLGVELKQEYFDQAAANLRTAERAMLSGTLLDFVGGE